MSEPLHVRGGPSPDELAAALAVLAARRAPGDGSASATGFAAVWRSVRRRALARSDQRHRPGANRSA
ncbi:MAG TPA: acyl-CoA carboxylase epsilon subunit [Actinomycetes bacterium]|nr:acyl-CoA carboxylase epsilon subunit [Actinomycetes bacterium]